MAVLTPSTTTARNANIQQQSLQQNSASADVNGSVRDPSQRVLVSGGRGIGEFAETTEVHDMVGGASLVEDGHESTPLRKLKKNIESTLNQHFEEVRSEEGLDLCHLRSSANVSLVAGEKRAWSSGSGMVRAAKKQKSSQLCFLKCNRSDGNLLICSVLSCPVAVHESCAGSSVNVMDSAEFLCPICSWRKADSAYRQTRNEARLVKEKLNLHKNQLSKSKCMLKEFQNQIKLIRKATVEPSTVEPGNDLHHGGGNLRNLNCRNVLNLEKRGKARVIIDLEGEDEETIGVFQRGLKNTAHYCASTSNVEELEIPRNQSKPAAFRSTYTKPDDVCQCHMPTDVEDVEDGQYTGSTRLRRSSPQLVNNFISRRVSTQRVLELELNQSNKAASAVKGVSIMDLSQASGNLSEEEVNPSQVKSELTTNAVVDGTPSSTNAAVKPKRKLKSDVWAGYEHVWEPAENNPERMVCWAKCLLCGEKKTTGPNSGTSNLRRHRISCSKRHQLICNVFLNL